MTVATSTEIPRRPQNVRSTSKSLATSDTPSAIIAKAASETASATDARGRVITVHRLNALQYYRLTKAMGATASNAATMDLAVIASSVKAIDDEDILSPGSELQIEHLMQRLDFDGLSAAGEALKSLSTSEDDGTEAAKN
jgi:hypothetical protein